MQALNSAASDFIRLYSCFNLTWSAFSGFAELDGDRVREISAIDRKARPR
jgi:hypothetical protein